MKGKRKHYRPGGILLVNGEVDQVHDQDQSLVYRFKEYVSDSNDEDRELLDDVVSILEHYLESRRNREGRKSGFAKQIRLLVPVERELSMGKSVSEAINATIADEDQACTVDDWYRKGRHPFAKRLARIVSRLSVPIVYVGFDPPD